VVDPGLGAGRGGAAQQVLELVEVAQLLEELVGLAARSPSAPKNS
jgi:hypothetical protein